MEIAPIIDTCFYFYLLGHSYFVAKNIRQYYFILTMDDLDPRKFLIPLKHVEVYKTLPKFTSISVAYLFYSWNIYKLALYVATLLCLCLYLIRKNLSKAEIDIIIERNNLSVGYGQALSYYENYLNITLQETKLDFQSRIRIFESKQIIKLPCKLFVLIPYSCRLIDHLDEIEHSYISRCREIESLDKNVAGIPARIYNISVYHIIYNNLSVRCALEYAQPLKALLWMKENNIFSEQEMYEQRNAFTRSLRKMLLANPDCNQIVELIEFNDLEPDFNLQNVLINHKSIEPFCKPFP